MTELTWRAMEPGDIDGVVAVAASAFPHHFEESACFAERLALFPQSCFALASARALRGYLIAYPWPAGTVPPHNRLLRALPETRDLFYLHDLALHPEVRGCGYARPIIERLAREAKAFGAGKIALVSVNDTVSFWRSMGFEPAALDTAVARNLATYGADATYMVHIL
jgi:GNAT superfamily N-acetyltransferase